MIEKPFPGWTNEWNLKCITRWVDEVTDALDAYEKQLAALTERVDNLSDNEDTVAGYNLKERVERLESSTRQVPATEPAACVQKDSEGNALLALIDTIGWEQKAKLLKKKAEGWHGWEDPEYERIIEIKLFEHATTAKTKADWVDVANFAAFLWNLAPESAENAKTDESIDPVVTPYGTSTMFYSITGSSADEPEPKEYVESTENARGRYICDNCGKDWGDGTELWYGYCRRPENQKDEWKKGTWLCRDPENPNNTGCRKHAVTWNPDSPSVTNGPEMAQSSPEDTKRVQQPVFDGSSLIEENYRLRAENEELHKDLRYRNADLRAARAENGRLLKGQRETNDKLKDAYADLTAARERIARYEGDVPKALREWLDKTQNYPTCRSGRICETQ